MEICRNQERRKSEKNRKIEKERKRGGKKTEEKQRRHAQLRTSFRLSTTSTKLPYFLADISPLLFRDVALDTHFRVAELPTSFATITALLNIFIQYICICLYSVHEVHRHYLIESSALLGKVEHPLLLLYSRTLAFCDEITCIEIENKITFYAAEHEVAMFK